MVQNMCMNLPGEGLRDIDSSESLVYFVVICIFYQIIVRGNIVFNQGHASQHCRKLHKIFSKLTPITERFDQLNL
jgi:hypothetical protein